MKFISIALTLLITGCVSNTGFVKTGDDTYMYGKQDYMAWSGSGVKAEMYKDAIAFCEQQGKKFEQIGSTAKDASSGWMQTSYAGAEIQFKCK